MHENRKSWKFNTWVNNIENENTRRITARILYTMNTHFHVRRATNNYDEVDDDAASASAAAADDDAYAEPAQPINC